MRSSPVAVALWVSLLALPACSSTGDGATCTQNSDCASFACVNSTCGNPTSCAALKSANPTATDGSYVIDPDGSGSGQPFTVWCDMTHDGGGWTALPLRFKDPALWSLAYSGSLCTDGPSPDDNGSLLSVYNGANSNMWSYLSVKFVPPIPVTQVWLKNLSHSTSTVDNNMDLTYTVTPESTGLSTIESWYFAGSDPKVPLAYTFADGCNSPGYAADPGWTQPVCSMARPGSDSLVTITREVKLSAQASGFHMVAVQGCGTDPPASPGQSERFHINHPAKAGVWQDGILVR